MVMETYGDVSVCIVAANHVDAGNSQELKEGLIDHLKAGRKTVIDLGNVGFMDSSGLGVLLACLREAHASGSRIKLTSMQKPVRMLFELVRMQKIFELFSTRDEAVASFGE